MSVAKQIVTVPVKGLETRADVKSAEPGYCDVIENMMFKRTVRNGGAELVKRPGGAALAKTGATAGASDTAVTSGRKLSTFDNERLLLDNDTLHSYSPQFGGWSLRGPIFGAPVTLEHIAEVPALGQFTGGTGYHTPDVAINGNLMALCWCDTATSRGAYFAIYDRNTGACVFPPNLFDTNIGANGWARVVALQTAFMFVTAKGGSNQIRATTIPYSNLAWAGSSTLIVSDLNAACKGDVIRNGSNDSALIVYQTTTPNMKVLVINSNLTAGSFATHADNPNQCINWLNWDFSDGKAWWGYVTSAFGLTYASTPTGATPAISAFTADAALTSANQLTGFFDGSKKVLYVEQRASPTYNTVTKMWSTAIGGAAAVLQRSCGIGAKVFKVGTKYYLPLAYESPLQSTYFVVLADGTSVRPTVVSRALYGLGGGLTLAPNFGASIVLADGTTVLVPVMRLSFRLGATLFFGIAIARLDFSGSSMSSPKRVGDNLHVPGGTVTAYAAEGNVFDRAAECGFFLFPETPSLAQAGGGSLTLLGTYQYVAVYAYMDARGQIHRSAPSAVATFTLTGGNQTITVTVPTLRVSGKSGAVTGGGNLTVEVYGTQNAGTTFYRLATQTINDPTADTVVVNDTASDTAKGSGEILYTSGGVLPHISPPSARLMESWHNRLFLAGTENSNELWVSNEYRAGQGVSFSDALVIAMESEGGPITALAEMDDRLLIFKRGAIYALSGNGPSLTGDGQFDQPIRVSSSVGAISQDGVIKMRDGVMFVSTRGIYLYTRGSQTVYIGAGVDSFKSLTVTGACALEAEEQVRFTTSAGRTLVYHYGLADDRGFGKWSTFLNQVAVDCIVWNSGVFAFLQSDGTVVEETSGAYSDPGSTAIAVTVRWAHIFLTQFFGRFRLYRLFVQGNILNTFSLTWSLVYEPGLAPAEIHTGTVTTTSDHPMEISPANRRCSMLQVLLSETSTTEGFTVTELGLEVGLLSGAAKQGLEKFV